MSSMEVSMRRSWFCSLLRRADDSAPLTRFDLHVDLSAYLALLHTLTRWRPSQKVPKHDIDHLRVRSNTLMLAFHSQGMTSYYCSIVALLLSYKPLKCTHIVPVLYSNSAIWHCLPNGISVSCMYLYLLSETLINDINELNPTCQTRWWEKTVSTNWFSLIAVKYAHFCIAVFAAKCWQKHEIAVTF